MTSDFSDNTASFNIGNLFLLQAGVSQDQLSRALEQQEKQPDRKLGEILIEMGALTQGALDAALAKQQSWRKHGPSKDDVRRMSDMAMADTKRLVDDLDDTFGELESRKK